MITNTPPPPYYAVIFTSITKEQDPGYSEMGEWMEKLVVSQPGYLGHESARSGLGITVSYWESLTAIKHWKDNIDHQTAQQLGRRKWYETYKIRIAKVEREYGWPI